MIKIDRICSWIFIISFIFLLPSSKFIKPLDELASYSLLAVALLDAVVNRNWARYRLLWMVIAVITFYAGYSLLFLDYNTPKAILVDWVIQLKPFIPFAAMLTVAPRFTPLERMIVRYVALANCIIISLLFLGGTKFVEEALLHISYAGIFIYVSVMAYLYFSIDEQGRLDRVYKSVALLFLTIGLACTRAKYYGIYVLTLYFLLLYRPGMMRGFSLKHFAIASAVVALVIIVAWNKITYYFLYGNSGTFDPNVMESYARPLLYASFGLILIDHIPFGSGLASFASYSSSTSYSTLYYEYGLDKIHGLSPDNPIFICDAFYPSLAQFGFVGVVLFIAFWVYVYRLLCIFVKRNPDTSRYDFVVGVLLCLFFAIESIASTTLVQAPGMTCMMLLGLICSKNLNEHEQK